MEDGCCKEFRDAGACGLVGVTEDRWFLYDHGHESSVRQGKPIESCPFCGQALGAPAASRPDEVSNG